MSNKEKSEQLGMSFSTASARLKKQIMFSLIKKLGEDVCFRCGNKIESVDELSVEHKIPWFGSNTELFWDLDNIAFSHLSCNSGSHNREKTHCQNDHVFDEDNTIKDEKGRACRKCHNVGNLKSYHKRKIKPL